MLSKAHNFMNEKNARHGRLLLKKLMAKIDFIGYVEFVEERFISEEQKNFLLIVLRGLSKGKLIQVVKTKDQPSQWNKEDRENLNNLNDMCPDITRKQVEHVYTVNEKNFELALNSLLSGEVPQEEEIKFVVQEDKQFMHTDEEHP